MISPRLKQAIVLLRSGHKDEARQALLQIVQQESLNEIAWFWLLETYDTDHERLGKLREYLAIHPGSPQAHQAERYLSWRVYGYKAVSGGDGTRDAAGMLKKDTTAYKAGQLPVAASARAAAMQRTLRPAPTHSTVLPGAAAPTSRLHPGSEISVTEGAQKKVG